MRTVSLFVILAVAALAVCFACGKPVAKTETPEQAVAAIKSCGGSVKLDGDAVVGVTLTSNAVNDATLAHLNPLMSQLQTLDLGAANVTDAGLAYLEGLGQLQKLDLSHTKVDDAGLLHLKGLNSLKDLDLSFTKVTDEGVKTLQQGLPKCSIKH